MYEKIKDKKGLILRITKIEIDNKKEKCLISNLSKEEFSEKDLKEIYEKRWKIENSYNSIKNKLKIVQLFCFIITLFFLSCWHCA